ncbi:hypothetical protein F9H64_22120 [Vibrio parahaemolyticus]|nr:hypothetical protein BGM07_016170 [Vibrio parahaemolyticus]AWA89699.1 hypothetical protein BSG32_11805 [Vibrio parahaemolyticus]EGQ9175698.1 hypothetical protein [Vibrio parahaemolyticus]EGQ9347899.1 hypothetical protein [Vibrio parahaemolyticus]EGQ9759299.1 hypothetical protein [Vibrio parahaemolyticus]
MKFQLPKWYKDLNHILWCQKPNKAFKSDSQRLAVSLRSSIAKRCSHLNAALSYWAQITSVSPTDSIMV